MWLVLDRPENLDHQWISGASFVLHMQAVAKGRQGPEASNVVRVRLVRIVQYAVTIVCVESFQKGELWRARMSYFSTTRLGTFLKVFCSHKCNIFSNMIFSHAFNVNGDLLQIFICYVNLAGWQISRHFVSVGILGEYPIACSGNRYSCYCLRASCYQVTML